MAITQLYFVRHAHSIYTPDEQGRPLSHTGFLDAEKVTQILAREDIDLVVSSPYKRAIQTVEGIAEIKNLQIKIEADFRERKLSDKPVADFEVAIKKVWEHPHFSWIGGESNILAQKRGIVATLQLLEKYQGKNIVIGTHGNIMVLIMNYFNHSYDYTFWKNLTMPDIYRLTFDQSELKEVKRIWK